MPNEIWIMAGIEAAKLWLDYASRAAGMTPEEARAEWQRVQASAVEARLRWERAGAQPDP